MNSPRFTSAKAALLHQGQARQPAPKPTSAKAAFMHHGQDRQPLPRFTTAKAAFLHNGQPIYHTRIYFVAGAGLDTDGWHYTQRWAAAFRQAGAQEFIPLTNVSHDAPGGLPLNDILFTSEFRLYTDELTPTRYNLQGVAQVWERRIKTDTMVDKAVDQIVADFHKRPLTPADKLVLIGYSYGSVVQSHVALKLHRMGYRVANLVLVGSPIPSNSQLYQALTKITQVERVNIPGDKLSNPTSAMQYFEGGQLRWSN